MERTIDGIDYIAKSEVLRIIDAEIASSEHMLERYVYDDPDVPRWEARIIGLKSVRECLEYSPGK